MKMVILTSLAEHVKSTAVRACASALFRSGFIDFLQSKARARLTKMPSKPRRIIPFAVLLYHRVNSERDPYFPSISTDVFDSQMRYLARNYRVLALREILDRIEKGLEIQPYTIAITFDDGYRDNFTHARPVLAKYRLPATLFVATGYIGSDQMMWNDRVSWAFKRTIRTHFRLEFQNRHLEFSLHSPADKINSLNLVLETLKSIPDEEKTKTVDSIVKELMTGTVRVERQMLSWSELSKLVQEGWDIGSHTVNHVILTRVNGAVVRDELTRSKQTLEQQLQRPISLFAYPNGKESDFNRSTKELVRQIGYKAATTTVDGLNDSGTDPWEIRRRSPWECSLPYFAVRLFYSYCQKRTQPFD